MTRLHGGRRHVPRLALADLRSESRAPEPTRALPRTASGVGRAPRACRNSWGDHATRATDYRAGSTWRSSRLSGKPGSIHLVPIRGALVYRVLPLRISRLNVSPGTTSGIAN